MTDYTEKQFKTDLFAAGNASSGSSRRMLAMATKKANYAGLLKEGDLATLSLMQQMLGRMSRVDAEGDEGESMIGKLLCKLGKHKLTCVKARGCINVSFCIRCGRIVSNDKDERVEGNR